MAPESHFGKRVLGMTAEDLDMTEEAFAQIVENLCEHVTDKHHSDLVCLNVGLICGQLNNTITKIFFHKHHMNPNRKFVQC